MRVGDGLKVGESNIVSLTDLLDQFHDSCDDTEKPGDDGIELVRHWGSVGDQDIDSVKGSFRWLGCGRSRHSNRDKDKNVSQLC